MKKGQIRTKRIIALASVTFFSLCANILATVAWFTANRNGENSNDYFAVENEGEASIESVSLYKFKYGETTYGTGANALTIVDWLTPETGVVKKYGFDYQEEKFGEVVDDTFVPVTVMNIYDPIDKLIKQSQFSLKDLNCNVVYEVVLSSSTFDTCYLDISANWLSNKTKTNDQIFLTDCVDFEVYYESDLSDSNPAFSTTDPVSGDPVDKLYYPSYINKNVTLTANEDVYYKLSYLSTLSNSHPHFYGSNPKPNSVSLVNGTPRQVTFDANGKLKILVNINYAPEQLDQYAQDIYESDIDAVYDFSLSFKLSSGGNA